MKGNYEGQEILFIGFLVYKYCTMARTSIRTPTVQNIFNVLISCALYNI